MIFKTDQLSFRYPSQRFNAVDQVSVEIEHGSFTSVIGANGSGKSTFIKLLGGLLSGFTGRLFFDDSDITTLKSTQLAKEIAYVPQTPELLFSMSVEEMVATGSAPYLDWWGNKTEQSEKLIRHSLEVCELLHVRHQSVMQLSGGEKQRVWIAKALVQNTPCILLDEPTAHLDIKHQVDVFRLLKSLQTEHNKTVVVACHDLNLASHFGTHAVLFQCGQILADGRTADVFTSEIIGKGFSVPVTVHSETKQVSVSF